MDDLLEAVGPQAQRHLDLGITLGSEHRQPNAETMAAMKEARRGNLWPDRG